MAAKHDMHITPPGSLRRVDAARYLGVSASHFDRMVQERRMPSPRDLMGVKVWLRQELDDALYATSIIGQEMEVNTCDQLFGVSDRHT